MESNSGHALLCLKVGSHYTANLLQPVMDGCVSAGG